MQGLLCKTVSKLTKLVARKTGVRLQRQCQSLFLGRDISNTAESTMHQILDKDGKWVAIEKLSFWI